jgi:hypothetical protein
MAQEQYFGRLSTAATAERFVSLSSTAHVMTTGLFLREK